MITSTSDNDGLADLWEDRYFGDNDGIVRNLRPDTHKTAPDRPTAMVTTISRSSWPTPILTDPAFSPANTDGDGLGDLWEDQYFGDNDGIVEATDLTPQNGSGDPDGDLSNNLAEFNGGVCPIRSTVRRGRTRNTTR